MEIKKMNNALNKNINTNQSELGLSFTFLDSSLDKNIGGQKQQWPDCWCENAIV